MDISGVIGLHKKSGRKATLVAVQPPGRYGVPEIRDDVVASFKEKPDGDGRWVNGGCFVLERSVIDPIALDDTIWEREPLEALAADKMLGVHRHRGFWQAMDTLRDKTYLDDMWKAGKAPWKIWS